MYVITRNIISVTLQIVCEIWKKITDFNFTTFGHRHLLPDWFSYADFDLNVEGGLYTCIRN